mmetsp:Transcript_104423/g.304815  ORF Transcript_104423/g.304815 Transcript_104423/m.304815 type:complete len:265 (+) Transcript_104423:266-1060(+)
MLSSTGSGPFACRPGSAASAASPASTSRTCGGSWRTGGGSGGGGATFFFVQFHIHGPEVSPSCVQLPLRRSSAGLSCQEPAPVLAFCMEPVISQRKVTDTSAPSHEQVMSERRYFRPSISKCPPEPWMVMQNVTSSPSLYASHRQSHCPSMLGSGGPLSASGSAAAAPPSASTRTPVHFHGPAETPSWFQVPSSTFPEARRVQTPLPFCPRQLTHLKSTFTEYRPPSRRAMSRSWCVWEPPTTWYSPTEPRMRMTISTRPPFLK